MNQQPSAEHFQRVINRLSGRIGAMTVENSSMAELLVEKEREILELKNEIADLNSSKQTIEDPQPVPVE